MSGWVRLWYDMPTDPKWRTIARKSGQRVGDVIAVFNFIMIEAGRNASERGDVGDGFDPEDVATALDLDEADIRSILDAMQGKVLDGNRLLGWEKRQPKREDSTAAKRKAEWKERQAERNGTHRNAQERPDSDSDSDTDSEIEEKKDTTPPRGGKVLAFDGRVIRLTETDYAKWRKSFSALDLDAVLQARDDWLATEADEKTRKRWFISTSNHFANLNQQARSRDGPRLGALC